MILGLFTNFLWIQDYVYINVPYYFYKKNVPYYYVYIFVWYLA